MDTFEYPFFNNSLKITHSAKGVIEIQWQKRKAKATELKSPRSKKVAATLDQFLAGKTDATGLTIDWENLQGTPFQKKVWMKMAKIPFGKTKSYGAIAKELKKPGAARAVGTACGANPVLLAIPCHRVVGSAGLGGFSGGGLLVKRRLLALEGHEQYI